MASCGHAGPNAVGDARGRGPMTRAAAHAPRIAHTHASRMRARTRQQEQGGRSWWCYRVAVCRSDTRPVVFSDNPVCQSSHTSQHARPHQSTLIHTNALSAWSGRHFPLPESLRCGLTGRRGLPLHDP